MACRDGNAKAAPKAGKEVGAKPVEILSDNPGFNGAISLPYYSSVTHFFNNGAIDRKSVV